MPSNRVICMHSWGTYLHAVFHKTINLWCVICISAAVSWWQMAVPSSTTLPPDMLSFHHGLMSTMHVIKKDSHIHGDTHMPQRLSLFSSTPVMKKNYEATMNLLHNIMYNSCRVVPTISTASDYLDFSRWAVLSIKKAMLHRNVVRYQSTEYITSLAEIEHRPQHVVMKCMNECSLYRFHGWNPLSMSIFKADSRLVSSQCETLLQSTTMSRWLGANLESALKHIPRESDRGIVYYLAKKKVLLHDWLFVV